MKFTVMNKGARAQAFPGMQIIAAGTIGEVELPDAPTEARLAEFAARNVFVKAALPDNAPPKKKRGRRKG